MNIKLNRLSQLIRISSALTLALVLGALPCAFSSAASSRVISSSLNTTLNGSVFVQDDTQSTDPSAQATDEQIRALMTTVNAQLEAAGADYRADYAQYITAAGSGEHGRIVWFSDRGNQQLLSDWVPGDPRRGGRTNITYIVDQTEGAIDGLTTAQTTGAIDRAMATWDGVNCSTIPITMQPNIPGLDLGVIEFRSGQGGSPFVFADITHTGFLPAQFIGANNVIAVTITFRFVSGGISTDIDNNGKPDVAFREILYNDYLVWAINEGEFRPKVDVETIALHEAGHGLSQDHFGEYFITDTPQHQAHFTPRAVMNALYTGIQQSLGATDLAGHCNNWASWPNN